MSKREGKILIIGRLQEFLAVNIRAELERRNFDVITCTPSVNMIDEAVNDDVKICLLFIEAAGELYDVYTYLKDNIFDKKVGAIVIGEKLGVKEAVESIGADNLEAVFIRPVDSKQVSDGVEKFHEKLLKSGVKKSILIIDDEPEYLRRTQRLFHNIYKVYIANSAASAMMVLAKHRVDLILLDYMMPVISGEQTLEMLKNEPETSSIPIIVLSGSESREAMEIVKIKGAEAYIGKRTAADTLVANVADFFVKKDYEKIKWGTKNVKKTTMMTCGKCMLGKIQCPLKQLGNNCVYEEMGLVPPEGRSPSERRKR